MSKQQKNNCVLELYAAIQLVICSIHFLLMLIDTYGQFRFISLRVNLLPSEHNVQLNKSNSDSFSHYQAITHAGEASTVLDDLLLVL